MRFFCPGFNGLAFPFVNSERNRQDTSLMLDSLMATRRQGQGGRYPLARESKRCPVVGREPERKLALRTSSKTTELACMMGRRRLYMQ